MSGKNPVLELERVARSFEPADSRRKLTLLKALGRRARVSPRHLLRLRDSLNFLRAYPDNAAVRRTTGKLIARLRDWVAKEPDGAEDATLWNTGFPGSYNSHAYSYGVVQRMRHAFPGQLDIDWDQLQDETPLTEAMGTVVGGIENQGMEDLNLSLPAWIQQGKGPEVQTDLEFVLQLFERSDLSESRQAHIFETSDTPISLSFHKSGTATSEVTFPTRQACYQRKPVDRVGVPIANVIQRPLAGIKHVPAKEGQQLVDLSLAELCSRNLEIYPLTYANPRDVYLVDCGRGISMLIAGVREENRSPFDSLFLFLMIKNGVAIAYGPISVFLGTCEMGINLFPEFRGGEVRYLYGQFMRTLHHFLGVEYFFLTRYGMGVENEAAIRTGAFWFYRKLGFHPTNPKVETLAQREEEKMRAKPGYRSSDRILRRLSHTEAYFDLSNGRCRPLSFGKLGLAVTRMITVEFKGNRRLAAERCSLRASRRLGIRSLANWSHPERRMFDELAPLVCLLPALESWSQKDRTDLIRFLRGKGAPSEVEITRRSGHMDMFRHALQELSDHQRIIE